MVGGTCDHSLVQRPPRVRYFLGWRNVVMVVLCFFTSVFGDCVRTESWHLDRLDQDQGVNSCYNATVTPRAKPILYLLDSGVYADHEEFVVKGTTVINGYNFEAETWDSSDCSGHGTHVAALAVGKHFGVAGTVPVDLVSVRILDCEGRGSCSGMIRAMNWVIRNHTETRPGTPGVVLMSVGSQSNECISADIAAEELLDANLLVVAAAGNSAVDACYVHPASSSSTLAVGAMSMNPVTAADVIWERSNHGDCVNLYAPGVRLTSAGISTPGDVRIMTGTSMAAPLVAGQALLIASAAPRVPMERVRDIIMSSSSYARLSDGDRASHPGARIAFVPWREMKAFDTLTHLSANNAPGLDDRQEGDTVVLALGSTSTIDPPMEYFATFIASELSTEISVMLEVKSVANTRCIRSTHSPHREEINHDAFLAQKHARQAQNRTAFRMICYAVTAPGLGGKVAHAVRQLAYVSPSRLKTPDGAIVTILSNPTISAFGNSRGNIYETPAQKKALVITLLIVFALMAVVFLSLYVCARRRIRIKLLG